MAAIGRHGSRTSPARRALLAVAASYQLRPDRVKDMAPDGFVTILASAFPFDSAADWLRKPTMEELQVLWPVEAAKRVVDVALAAYGVESGLHEGPAA